MHVMPCLRADDSAYHAGHTMIHGKSKELIGIDSPGEYAVITVSDTGIGMKEKTGKKYSSHSLPRKRLAREPASAFPSAMGLSSSIMVQSPWRVPRVSAPVFTIYLPLIQMDVEVTPCQGRHARQIRDRDHPGSRG